MKKNYVILLLVLILSLGTLCACNKTNKQSLKANIDTYKEDIVPSNRDPIIMYYMDEINNLRCPYEKQRLYEIEVVREASEDEAKAANIYKKPFHYDDYYKDIIIEDIPDHIYYKYFVIKITHEYIYDESMDKELMVREASTFGYKLENVANNLLIFAQNIEEEPDSIQERIRVYPKGIDIWSYNEIKYVSSPTTFDHHTPFLEAIKITEQIDTADKYGNYHHNNITYYQYFKFDEFISAVRADILSKIENEKLQN